MCSTIDECVELVSVVQVGADVLHVRSEPEAVIELVETPLSAFGHDPHSVLTMERRNSVSSSIV